MNGVVSPSLAHCDNPMAYYMGQELPTMRFCQGVSYGVSNSHNIKMSWKTDEVTI